MHSAGVRISSAELLTVSKAVSAGFPTPVPMPDFMQGLADGIIKSKKVIAKAVSGVADTMKIALNTDLSYKLDGMTGAIMNGGIESSVVNNYYNNDNSRTVNQTNNSPKSLSRLEIYRQTKNAVKM